MGWHWLWEGITYSITRGFHLRQFCEGTPKHGHFKTVKGNRIKTSIWQTGWREGLWQEWSSSPNIQQTEAEGAGTAGLVSITVKGAECRWAGAWSITAPVSFSQQIESSPSELRDKQYFFFLNHEARFKGRHGLWCCIRRRDDSGKTLYSPKAMKPELFVVFHKLFHAKHHHSGQQLANLKWTFGPDKTTPLAVREASLF